jgi:hypothetical protein
VSVYISPGSAVSDRIKVSNFVRQNKAQQHLLLTGQRISPVSENDPWLSECNKLWETPEECEYLWLC